ncbi:crotonase/enoyl-CoA hydratase family protein [Nocardia sp. alder85J]|uniref:crotonase/enoyl-CoA hydratase family protein n=1 Tax=Nocardia sp. alder85J TaxID=2862949 RepID=UPI001CD37C35|nr:crotonase/enoyl-CoA hydratase family protein [Nocardia sp. alder85J]MCX4092389.1 crotonase/enoyl-CoA hydratase family protein [Nocardia sp. alder85J]
MRNGEPTLPASLDLERHGDVAVLTLNRVSKRNALDDDTIRALGAWFGAPPRWVRAVVLAAAGEHFSAGLDLSSLDESDAFAGLHHSRMWHEAFARIEAGTLPVVAVLKGAVIGGGLELASAAHVRVAEESAYFALPEGQRGLFVGGGGSVRLPRLIGAHRMADMMLTGRVLSVAEATDLGLVNYRVAEGAGLARGIELATRIADNSPVSNYAVLQALPKIASASPEVGYLLESLMAAVAQSSDEAKRRMTDFLAGRAGKVTATGNNSGDQR